MQKSSVENDVLEDLKYIFQNVNNWLNFAELKNGALLVFSSGVILARFQIRYCNSVLIYSILNVISIVSILLGILLSALSFSPKINKVKVKVKKTDIGKNLIFFNDIMQYKSSDEYLKDIYINYYQLDVNISDLNSKEKHLAEEIFENSKITFKKYNLFKWALRFSLLGIILLTFIMIKLG